MFFALLMSGALAGLAGGIEVMGTMGKVINGFSANYGFSGIPVALMAPQQSVCDHSHGAFNGKHAQRISDDDAVQRRCLKNMVDIIQGLVIVFLCAENVIPLLHKEGAGRKIIC